MVTRALTDDEFEKLYVRPRKGRTLIVGSKVYRDKGREDRRLRYESAFGIDLEEGEGVDRVLDLEDPLPEGLGTFAHVECICVLEHSRRPWLLAANIDRLLIDGGTLHVQVPFIWRVHAYPNDYWRMTIEGVKSLFPTVIWETIDFITGDRNKGIPNLWYDELLYFARTEICGFGRKHARLSDRAT